MATSITLRPPTHSTAGSDSELLALVGAFARLYLEVLAGRRDWRQLSPLVSPRVAFQLTRAEPVRPRGARQPLGQVRAVFGTRTATNHFDAVVLLQRGRRFEALAVRLRRSADGWRISAAGRPQDQTRTSASS